MAKKKRNKNQIPMAFPPELSPELITIWTTLKGKEPGSLVLLAHKNIYFTIDTDAVTLSELADLPLISTSVLLSYFPAPKLDDILHVCLISGLRVVISEPL